MNTYSQIAGIDLGGRTTSKTAVAVLAGTTVTLYDTLAVAQITAGSDANFITWLRSLNLELIGLDAPLSLPDFTQPDYLYRLADRSLSALSPMSMGEVTARALHIKSHIQTEWLEVYPKAVLAYIGLPSRRYKTDAVKLASVVDAIQQRYGWQLPDFPLTGDNVDALLALVSTWHYATGSYIQYNTAERDAPPFIGPA